MVRNFYDNFFTVILGFFQLFSRKNNKKNREIYKRLLMIAEFDKYECCLKQIGGQVGKVKPLVETDSIIDLRKQYKIWQENIKQYDSLRSRIFSASQ